MAKLVGIFITVCTLLWDIDAMRPHVAAHSWLTLAYVSLFFVGHAVDALTTGFVTFSGGAKKLYS